MVVVMVVVAVVDMTNLDMVMVVVMVLSVLLTWIQAVPALSCCCPAGIWSLCVAPGEVSQQPSVTQPCAAKALAAARPGWCWEALPRHPPALPEPLLCTRLLPILPVPLHTLAPRAHPHPEPTHNALAERKAFLKIIFGLHGFFDGFFPFQPAPHMAPPTIRLRAGDSNLFHCLVSGKGWNE